MGRLDRTVIESELLRGNPLGDPHVRPLWVYTPPGYDDGDTRYPAVYVIQGYTGHLTMWDNRSAYRETFPEAVDGVFARGEAPGCVVVFVDAWTAYGGSQFVDSSGTGRYHSYLCDEVVPFVDSRYRTIADRSSRAISGKSSGGFGAMIVPMLRPEVFGALASHAGDALYEACYLPTFPDIARKLRDDFDGSYDVFFRSMAEADHFDMTKWGDLMLTYGCAAAFTPDPDHLGKALLPFELDTGRIIDERWARWLALDPVRMVPQHAEALRSMRRIYLDAGRGDEWYLDLGATAVASELEAIGAAHTLELFDGKHGGIAYRYPRALRELAVALSA